MANATSISQNGFDELRSEWDSDSAVLTWEDELVRLIDEWREVEWRSGGRTLLTALGLQYQEVPLCRGLAWLLDPEGGHRMGRYLLDGLLRSLNLPASGDAPVEIRVEESRHDTRADIVLRVGRQTVIIEAKIQAGEQTEQADRLYKHWADEDPTLVFLTRTGRMPHTAVQSVDRWAVYTWREIAQLARRVTDTAALDPSAGAREFVETIGAL